MKMKAQHQTLQGEDAYRANLRPHCSPAPAERKVDSAVLSEHDHQQAHDPCGGFALLVQAQIAAALARTT
jgi:hypothetical protein